MQGNHGLRMRPTKLLVTAAAMGLASAFSAQAQDAVAEMRDKAGHDIGNVEIHATPSGLGHVLVSLKDLQPGVHAIHVHEKGACAAPEFTSAGGHLALGKEHGIQSKDGPHPGDLPNLHVPSSGAVMVEYFAPNLPMTAIFGSDGSSVIVHARADDYKSQPSGDAGGRIACGVLKKTPEK